jgi:hypothetical protein
MAEAIVLELLAEYTPEEAARVVARSPYLGDLEGKREAA